MNSAVDYVVRNDVLKSQEVLEEKARRDWYKKWGFYLEHDKILLEEARKNGIKNEEFGRMVRERKSKMNLENDIWKTDAIDYVPRTSSGYVGWRSNPNSSLEKFGPLYISPRHTLPYQPPYNCIILG